MRWREEMRGGVGLNDFVFVCVLVCVFVEFVFD